MKNKHSNKTKLLVDCHVFDGKAQGTTTYLKGIYSELIQNKDVLFYFISYYPDNVKSIFGEQSNIIYLKYPSKNKFKRLLIDLPLIIKKYSIEFAHFQYIVPPIKNCKYIVTIHDILFLDYPKFFPFLYRLKNKLLFSLSAKKADYVLTVSNYSKEKLLEHFKLKEVYLTPNAVDEIFFEEYNKVQNQNEVLQKYSLQNYFLFVSRREPRKNHLNLLKAFVINNFYKNHQLVFIGSKDITDVHFEDYYNSLSIEITNKVIFLEKINFKELISLTRAATISVYPSFAEGFGIPPLESIAANVPTICSNTTAMAEFTFMKDFLFDPNSIEEIGQKITFAISQHSAKKIRETVKEKYSWKISASVLNNILRNG